MLSAAPTASTSPVEYLRGFVLWQLVRWLPRSAGAQERQRQAGPGQHGAGQEGRLVALGQRGDGFAPLSAAR